MTIIPKLQIAFAALNTVMAANPILLIVAAIAALVLAFIHLWNTSEDFRNFWIGLWDKISSTVMNVVDGIKKFFTEKIPKMIDELICWFKELPGKIKQAGIDMITGLWEGIKETFARVKDNILGLFTGLVDKIKNLLGIHSPSKVFAGIGDNMAKGLAVGWDKEIGKVQRELTVTANKAYGFSGGKASGSTPTNTTTNHHTYDISQPINVNIDPRNMQEFERVVDYFDNYRRRARAAGKGRTPEFGF